MLLDVEMFVHAESSEWMGELMNPSSSRDTVCLRVSLPTRFTAW